MLYTVPVGLSAASAAIENLVSVLVSEHMAAASIFAAIVPPAADVVSLRSAVSCGGHVSDHNATAGQAISHLQASAQETDRSARNYLSCDVLNAARMGGQL